MPCPHGPPHQLKQWLCHQDAPLLPFSHLPCQRPAVLLPPSLSSTPPPPPRHFISFLERRVWAGDFLFLHFFKLFFFFSFLISPLSCSFGSGGADPTARHGNCLQPLPEPAAGADLEAPMELHFMFVLLRGAVGRILSLSPPLPPALRPIPSCRRGGSEQPFTCSALQGLPQEWVFPSSVSPARDRCPPMLGRCRDVPRVCALPGTLCRSPSPCRPVSKAPP